MRVKSSEPMHIVALNLDDSDSSDNSLSPYISPSTSPLKVVFVDPNNVNSSEVMPAIIYELKTIKHLCEFILQNANDSETDNIPAISTASEILRNLKIKELKNSSFAIVSVKLKEIKEKIEKITRLHMHAKGLDTLPISIVFLKGITHLGLMGNKFKTLPETLLCLPNLRNLDLKGNEELCELPEFILKHNCRELRIQVPGTGIQKTSAAFKPFLVPKDRVIFY